MTSNKCAPNHNIGLSHATRVGGESRARHERGQVQKGDSGATCMQIKGPPPTSFQAKHNPSLSIRPSALSFSGLNKKLFSSAVPCPPPPPFSFRAYAQQTMFSSTHLARGARTRAACPGSNVGPATEQSYSRRDREDPSSPPFPLSFSISQIQLQKRCLSRCHSIQTRCVLVSLELPSHCKIMCLV